MNLLWDNIFKNKNKKESVAQKLKENVLFRDLGSQELRLLNKIVHVRRYRPGEPVFSQGEVGVGMYIIASGSINIFIEEITTDTDAPKQSFVTRLQDGDFFGELSLVEEGGKRSASAIAQEESMLIGFFKPDLIEIMGRNPAAGVKILFRLAEVLGYRLKETTAKISELRKELKLLQHELLNKGTQHEKNLHTKGYSP